MCIAVYAMGVKKKAEKCGDASKKYAKKVKWSTSSPLGAQQRARNGTSPNKRPTKRPRRLKVCFQYKPILLNVLNLKLWYMLA